jgi:CheY-like chemotaxis protein
MPGGGTLRLSAENVVLDERFASKNLGATSGPHVLLKVSDTGCGIAPEIMEKIFDPFFSTKESGRGTGLGLSTVLGIAKGHGGFVRVHSEPGRGSTFAVYLPAAPQTARAADTRRDAPSPGGRGELILVVEDEQPIRELASEILQRNGYEVLTAADGTEALALFEKRRDKIGVVLTDVSMPVMDGVALIRELAKMRPDVKVIAASGRGSGGQGSDLRELGIRTVLAKPYTAESLITALHEVLTPKQT